MLDAIIKLLGGYTRHEYELQNTSLDGWRNRAISAETSVQLFNEILSRERESRTRLEEYLSGPKHQDQQAPNMKPVGNTMSSWPRIRRELEKRDRGSMKEANDAGVSREEIEKTIRSGQQNPV